MYFEILKRVTEKRAALAENSRQNGHTCSPCVGESGVPVAVIRENALRSIRGHLKTYRGGCRMLLHHDRASIVLYFVEMAQTRGGKIPSVAPPRVYMTPFGVKVRKVHGGYVFQPPSLKVSSYLALDRFHTRAGRPQSRLYEGVQKILDHLLDQVEDRLLGLDDTGIL